MKWSMEWKRLKEVDWRELDIKEAGDWPLLLKLGCAGLLLLATFWAAQAYLVTPRQDALEKARLKESELLDEYRVKAVKAARLPAMSEQMNELEARLDRLLDMLPSGAEIPSLIDNISETAIDNQLTIESIRLRPRIKQDFYTEQPFDIRVSGDYHRIASFLAGVAGLPRIVTQHDFTLSPSDEGRLTLSMLARTYSYSPTSDDQIDDADQEARP
ncbi:pilus assembly protein PilO [Pistricoccus aurantiacus]|uniref:Pilus assembly protein PilO n=1 Tax=Pistricoccus aurantiacus TaxID=1883414 RepID=A0A5B8SS94_9GAMM|nr:type 4a pilus biogenesis protein PilO [Pistricoccus aurantiacus]QEA37963.1 pilus assembly protein PilO [Pistricoccus aurantiacus]